MSINTDSAVREQFSLFVRGETDSLDSPRWYKEQILKFLWPVTIAMPTVDCEALELPAGTPYGLGVRKLVLLVAPDQADELITTLDAKWRAELDLVGAPLPSWLEVAT